MRPARRPDDFVALLRQASAAIGASRWSEGEAALEAAAAFAPAHPDLLHLRGLARQGRRDLAGAASWIRRALEAAPGTPSYLANLGAIEHERGLLDAAEAVLSEALSLHPDHAKALNNLGAVHAARGRYADAAACFRSALTTAPGDVGTLVNLALAEARAGDGAAALASADAALRAAPRHAGAMIARGLALMALGRFGDAEHEFARATAGDPRSREAWHNLGHARAFRGREAAAIAAYETAARLDPAGTGSFADLALCRLALGDYARGWAEFRRGRGFTGERLPPELRDRAIRIVRDQGIGDDLFFLRFAPELVRRGATVTLDVEPRLHSMLERAGFTIAPAGGLGGGEPIVSADLPWRLGHAADAACPKPLALEPDRGRIAALENRLAAVPRPWIAVAWRAGVDSPGRPRKELPPAALGAALARVPGSVLIVQREPTAPDMSAFTGALGRAATDLSAANADLEEMLALMACADGHVAVSNTNLHLRAACGRPTHTLIARPVEWRWRDRGDGRSPWFPDHPRYVQRDDGDWRDALARLAAALSSSA